MAHLGQGRSWSLGISYDSSPVEDEHRTIDLPFDEQYKLSGSYSWKSSEKLAYSVGSTLAYLGEGKIDQVAQGMRMAGEFDNNYILMLGGTLLYRF